LPTKLIADPQWVLRKDHNVWGRVCILGLTSSNFLFFIFLSLSLDANTQLKTGTQWMVRTHLIGPTFVSSLHSSLRLEDWCLNGARSQRLLCGLRAKIMSTDRFWKKWSYTSTLLKFVKVLRKKALHAQSILRADRSIEIPFRVSRFLSRNYWIFDITPPEGAWEMCPLLKRRVLLHCVRPTPEACTRRGVYFDYYSLLDLLSKIEWVLMENFVFVPRSGKMNSESEYYP